MKTILSLILLFSASLVGSDSISLEVDEEDEDATTTQIDIVDIYDPRNVTCYKCPEDEVECEVGVACAVRCFGEYPACFRKIKDKTKCPRYAIRKCGLKNKPEACPLDFICDTCTSYLCNKGVGNAMNNYYFVVVLFCHFIRNAK